MSRARRAAKAAPRAFHISGGRGAGLVVGSEGGEGFPKGQGEVGWREGGAVDNVWTQLVGTLFICTCGEIAEHRPPSARRATQFRMKVAPCPGCKRQTLNRAERDRDQLLVRLNTGLANGKIRRRRP